MEPNPTSKIENYSHSELLETLEKLKKEFPASYKWFIIWELEKMHGARRNSSGLGQEQEENSGQTQ